jgi:mannose-6-phosphate isomerase-like protein (cupin superfamily)
MTSDTAEFLTRERCFIREIVNNPDIRDFSLAQVRVEAGVQTELHKLSVNEWYVIASGQGLMDVGEAPSRAVGPGDIVAIPAGTSQRIRNTGQSDLEFQCICLPRFTTDSYESLESD